MNKTQKAALAPGSPEAIEQGCKCDAMANALGAGAGPGSAGKPKFWYSSECPIHFHLVPAELR